MANRNDYEEIQQIKDSLKVSSYKDQIIDALASGKKVQAGYVPNFSDGSHQSGQNESSSLFPMTLDYMAGVAVDSLARVHGVTSAIQEIPSLTKYAAAQTQTQNDRDTQFMPSEPRYTISKRQYNALQKYPALIEFLGTNEGDSIAREVAAKVNLKMVGLIQKNSQAANKFAQTCVAERQNLKQYFVGDNESWVCCVTASGPFRGDEAIFYHKDLDKASVLRSVGQGYEDVSGQFNVIHEYAEK